MGTGLNAPPLATGEWSATSPIRLIIDPPCAGTWNMAVDEALFQVAQQTGRSTFRLYAWEEPTITLGYFQSFADRHGHAASQSCPVVRRSTGGGAIVHDVELTYSWVVPLPDDRAASSLRLVRQVHESLIAVLTEMGLPANRHEEVDRPAAAAPVAAVQPGGGRRTEPFLCFQRRTADDVVAGGWKVVGSAQRKLHGTLLQHGSILLGKSAAAPELPGISELLGRTIAREAFERSWRTRLGDLLKNSLQPGEITSEEFARAERIERDKFRTEAWNQRR